jgi:cytochrome P450
VSADLADPDLHASGRIQAEWRRLRESRPVHWQPGPGGGFWSVTRHADVDRVLRDHASFTSRRGTLLNLLGRPDPAGGRQLAATDPPAHDQMRQPLQRAMGLRPAGSLAPAIRAGVRGLLGPGLTGEPFDLAAALVGLPLVLTGPLLGLPAGDWPSLARLALMCSAEDDPRYQVGGDRDATLRQAHRRLFGYFVELVRRRTRSPGNDLVSLLLAEPEVAPGTVVANCYSLLLGAAVTLPNVPLAAVPELARPDRYRWWAGRPDLLDTGVEEALRWASPASHFMRHARHPVEVSGVTIAQGDAVVAWIGSANRDPAVFTRPEDFDPARQPNRHLAFGSGHHYCLGSHLARLTLRVFFGELFATCRRITVLEEPMRVRSTFLSGFTRMMVALEPTSGRCQ